MRTIKLSIVGLFSLAAVLTFANRLLPGFTTTGQATAFSAPTNVAASDNAYATKVGITWDTIRGATLYRIFRNPANDPTSAVTVGTTADVAERARAVRRVAENATLVQQEFNHAFVLMQYFGYLRRNPNDAPDANFDGYNFWLGKLNQFNGDFVGAEMVKAFLVSSEYRRRFGP